MIIKLVNDLEEKLLIGKPPKHITCNEQYLIEKNIIILFLENFYIYIKHLYEAINQDLNSVYLYLIG